METAEQRKLEQLVKRDRAAWDRTRRSEAEANERRSELIAMVGELHAAGVSLSVLAEALGISKARVHQILSR